MLKKPEPRSFGKKSTPEERTGVWAFNQSHDLWQAYHTQEIERLETEEMKAMAEDFALELQRLRLSEEEVWQVLERHCTSRVCHGHRETAKAIIALQGDRE